MRQFTPAILATTIILSLSLDAIAQQHRANTNSMTCTQARAVVKNAGAIVLSTGTYTYERYVRDRSFCEMDQILKSERVPTSNNNRCLIGYKCVYYSGGPRDD